VRTRLVSSLLAVHLASTFITGVAAAALPSAGCSRQTSESGDRIERTIEVAGVTRHYILHVPQSAKPGRPAPLLLDFHGWGHSAAGVWRVSRFKEIAERDGFITVYPDGLPVTLLRGEARPGWEIAQVPGNRDLAFTTALLDRLEAELCVDRARVYSTGFSNGAFFSHILGCVQADRIAAIAPVSGGHITVPCKPGRPVPVLIFHGTSDDLISPERAHRARDEWARIDECGEPKKGVCDRYSCKAGVEVRYCEVDIGHTWPPQATEEIWKFLREYSLPAPTGAD